MLGWPSSFPFIFGVSLSLTKTSPDNARQKCLLHRVPFLALLGTQLNFLAWRLGVHIHRYSGAGRGTDAGSRAGGGAGVSSKYSVKVLGRTGRPVVYGLPRQSRLQARRIKERDKAFWKVSRVLFPRAAPSHSLNLSGRLSPLVKQGVRLANFFPALRQRRGRPEGVALWAVWV